MTATSLRTKKTRPQRNRLGRPPGSQGEQTRRRILDAALDLFAGRGFEATTTRDIASRAGLSDAGLYAHFTSKRQVFEELFHAAGPQVVAFAVSRSPKIGRGPEQFVKAVVELVLTRWSDPLARKFMAVVLRECTQPGSGVPSLTEGIAEALKETATILRPWIRQGLIRSDFPAEHLAWELFAPLINLRLAYLHPNASESEIARAKALGRRHAEFFLSSVMKSRKETKR
jgi:AcrR family transcriptional regulator